MVGKLQVATNGSPFQREYIGNMDTPNYLLGYLITTGFQQFLSLAPALNFSTLTLADRKLFFLSLRQTACVFALKTYRTRVSDSDAAPAPQHPLECFYTQIAIPWLQRLRLSSEFCGGLPGKCHAIDWRMSRIHFSLSWYPRFRFSGICRSSGSCSPCEWLENWTALHQNEPLVQCPNVWMVFCIKSMGKPPALTYRIARCSPY